MLENARDGLKRRWVHGAFLSFLMFARAGDLYHLLDHVVQELGLRIFRSTIVDFFAFTAAGDEPGTLELLEMVAHRRAGHADHGRDVDDTFLTVAEEPEDADAVAIAKLLKDIGDDLKIVGCWHLREYMIGELAVVVRQGRVG